MCQEFKTLHELLLQSKETTLKPPDKNVALYTESQNKDKAKTSKCKF